VNSGLFAERDLQLKASYASPPPCTAAAAFFTGDITIFTGHFPQKRPTIIGSFAQRDLQLIRHLMHCRHPALLLLLLSLEML